MIVRQVCRRTSQCSVALESIAHGSQIKDKRQWDAIIGWARVAMEVEEACLWAKYFAYSSLGIDIRSDSRAGGVDDDSDARAGSFREERWSDYPSDPKE
jgi:hypothetical protein